MKISVKDDYIQLGVLIISCISAFVIGEIMQEKAWGFTFVLGLVTGVGTRFIKFKGEQI